MKKFRIVLPAIAALIAMAAGPADAALYVSGDSNIFTSENSSGFTTTAANRQFLLNIAGSNVLIKASGNGGFDDSITTGMGNFLTSAGIANNVLASTTAITAAELAGRSLVVGYFQSNGYSASELSALTGYLNGGGSVLITGENANALFAAGNVGVNNALVAFGSSMRLVPGSLTPGYATATVVTDNSATAGTTGFRYAYTSSITGGTSLYATTGGVTFLAGEGITAVPEPASWALMIVGIGAVGGAMRRRKSKTTTSVAYA